MVVDELSEMLREFNTVAVDKELCLDIFTMYQAFYYQHKFKHGSFKPLLKEYSGKYDEHMQKRYDYIVCQINDTIEGKIAYQNGLQQE